MEKSKKRLVAVLIILVAVFLGPFSRAAGNVRPVDALMLIAGGMCLGALLSVLLQKRNV